jgi:hypothetical protein
MLAGPPLTIYTQKYSDEGKSCVTFDAQCDLAAVVYGPDDDPDRLFIDFAGDLSRSGRRPIGLIQVGRTCRAEDPGLGAVVLPDGDVVSLVEDLPACTAGCRLDAGRLADIAERLAGALAGGSDLVIINRFGRSEAAGGGLADLITRAIGADIPVLVAVPEHRFASLIKFADGMNVRLACRREALDRWWQSVAGLPARRRQRTGGATFCEIWK